MRYVGILALSLLTFACEQHGALDGISAPPAEYAPGRGYVVQSYAVALGDMSYDELRGAEEEALRQFLARAPSDERADLIQILMPGSGSYIAESPDSVSAHLLSVVYTVRELLHTEHVDQMSREQWEAKLRGVLQR